MLLMCLSILSMLGCVGAFSLSPSSSLHRLVQHQGNQHSAYSANVNTYRNTRTLDMRWGLKGNNPQQKIEGVSDGVNVRDTVPFEIRGFSLPLVVFSVGIALTAGSFAGYFLNEGGGEGALSSLGFVYGIPVFLIGLSLWYAEIPPVEVISSPAGDAIWDRLSTEIFVQVKNDVTRHRYGDDAHLDSTLEALGLKLPQKKFPKLLSITQEDEDGELAFTLAFQSLETPYKVWADPERVKRYATFFGPDVTASVYKMDSEKRIVALKLKTTSKGVPSPEQPPQEKSAPTPVIVTEEKASAEA